LESSADWNYAGTGHSALCELNYTPKNEDGSIDISKALRICKQFEISKQFWSYLVKNKLIENPETFIQKTPHYSWVAVALFFISTSSATKQEMIKIPIFMGNEKRFPPTREETMNKEKLLFLKGFIIGFFNSNGIYSLLGLIPRGLPRNFRGKFENLRFSKVNNASGLAPRKFTISNLFLSS
jgi:hypothetical protein